jgi:hypothetical protein
VCVSLCCLCAARAFSCKRRMLNHFGRDGGDVLRLLVFKTRQVLVTAVAVVGVKGLFARHPGAGPLWVEGSSTGAIIARDIVGVEAVFGSVKRLVVLRTALFTPGIPGKSICAGMALQPQTRVLFGFKCCAQDTCAIKGYTLTMPRASACPTRRA